MMAIDTMIAELLNREGGYSNNPNDKGGETNFGITKAQARAYGFTGDMRALPKATAAMIYKELYWAVPKFDQIAPMMPKVAVELFDTGVNMGPQRASRFLQRALNVLNRGGRDYPDLDADGQLGKLSLYALAVYKQRRGKDAETVLLRLLESEQAVRYMELAEANASQEDFVFGWVLNRVGDL
jgi:lysozyme family protein